MPLSITKPNGAVISVPMQFEGQSIRVGVGADFLDGLLDAGPSAPAFNPATLFASGEQGIWLDPSDLSTMFQDTAGTTPITTPGQAVARINDKSGNGHNATQATSTARPRYGVLPKTGRRNLLTYTEQFNNAVWTKGGTSTIATGEFGQIFRCGSSGVSQLTSATYSVGAGAVFSQSIFARPEVSDFVILTLADLTSGAFQRSWFNLLTGEVGSSASSGTTVTSPVAHISGPDANGRYRCTLSATFTNATTTRFALNISDSDNAFDGDASSGVYIFGAQLSAGAASVAYQRVVSDLDVTEEGVLSLHYLYFDGVNDFMVTPTITPGTDKVQVFAGLRKQTESTEFVIEHSADLNSNNGTFYVAAPITSFATLRSFGGASKGTTQGAAFMSSDSFPSPSTNVVSFLGDVSGDLSTLRVDGTQVAQSTDDQGTGNYLAYPMYIGSRGGSSLHFDGRIFNLGTRFGDNLDLTTIQDVEEYVTGKTKVTL